MIEKRKPEQSKRIKSLDVTAANKFSNRLTKKEEAIREAILSEGKKGNARLRTHWKNRTAGMPQGELYKLSYPLDRREIDRDLESSKMFVYFVEIRKKKGRKGK